MKQDRRGKDVWKRLGQDVRTYIGSDIVPWSLRFWCALMSQVHRHPGLIAVIVYRYGQWARYGSPKALRLLCVPLYYILYNWVRTRLHIELPASTIIGGGLHIYHYGGIIINGDLVAGNNLSINHGVVIGKDGVGEISVPRIGNNVNIKVGAKVFGPITLGNNVVVGAGAVVVKSFPDNAIVVGVPAKVLRIETPPHSPNADQLGAE